MKDRWNEWSIKFAEMTQREKVLISVTTIAVTFGLMLVLWIEPMELALDRSKKQTVKLSSEMITLSSEIVILEERLAVDPNDTLNSEISVIALQIKKLDSRIQEKTADLIPANKMASVLSALLPKPNELELVAFESLPPAPLLPLEDDYQDVNLYQHGIRMQLSGSYFDIMTYMQSVESLPWEFIWGKLDYSVSEYPKAEVELLLFSISAEKEFIGV